MSLKFRKQVGKIAKIFISIGSRKTRIFSLKRQTVLPPAFFGSIGRKLRSQAISASQIPSGAELLSARITFVNVDPGWLDLSDKGEAMWLGIRPRSSEHNIPISIISQKWQVRRKGQLIAVKGNEFEKHIVSLFWQSDTDVTIAIVNFLGATCGIEVMHRHQVGNDLGPVEYRRPGCDNQSRKICLLVHDPPRSGIGLPDCVDRLERMRFEQRTEPSHDRIDAGAVDCNQCS